MKPGGSLPHSRVPAICPIPSRIDPVHAPTFHFLMIHLNIILIPTPGSPKWSPSLRFRHQNPVYTSPLPHRATCPANLILNFITRTIAGKQHRSIRSSLFSFLHFPVTSSLLGPNIRLNTLLSNTFSLRCSLNVSHHFTTIHNNRKNYRSVYPNLHIFGY